MTTSSQARILQVLTLADEVPTAAELATFLADDDANVRRTAIDVLAESAPGDAGAALASALLDDDATVRHAAIEALTELRELVEADDAFAAGLLRAGASPDPAVRSLTLQLQREHHLGGEETFAAGLDDADPGVRRQAVAGLVALGSASVLATAHTDGDPLVRRAAARGLATIGDPETANALLSLAEDTDVRVRAAALEAFAAVGCPPILAAAAANALLDAEWSVRRGAALGLKAAPAEMALPPLLLALRDENLDVRKAAVQALSAWAPGFAEVADALEAMLDDPDADVRAYARMALP